MLGEPVSRTFHQETMEPCVGNPGFHLFYEAFRQSALEETKGEIDQVTFPEHLNKRKPVVFVLAYLVMPFDHQADFF